MDTFKQIVLQEMNELRFNRKHIDGKIREEIKDSPEMMAKHALGVTLVHEYMAATYYESKDLRIAQLKPMNISNLVMDVFVGIAYAQIPELFTSVSAKLASRLKFNDRTEAITTVAEILAVLCETDAFDITKADKNSSLMVVSRINLSDNLIDFILSSEYLPPMVCEPLELTNNYSSGYLTHNDSLILGSGNHHDGDICLDVLNTINKVAMKLDIEFLSTVEEEPKHKPKNRQAQEQWDAFKKQSYQFYSLMVDQGNNFYLTHKVDKRGRIYACGYHISSQGTAFKKASLELSNEELVEGVF